MENRSIDATKHKGLEQAFIIFFSQSGNLVSTITDTLGKFKVVAKHADTYMVRAQRIGYLFPTKHHLTIKDLYVPPQAIKLEAGQESTFMPLTVALDPKELSSYSPIGKLFYFVYRLFNILYIPILVLTMFSGFIALVLAPSLLTGGLLFIAAMLFFYSKWRKRSA
jgi:hypothetical protein